MSTILYLLQDDYTLSNWFPEGIQYNISNRSYVPHDIPSLVRNPMSINNPNETTIEIIYMYMSNHIDDLKPFIKHHSLCQMCPYSVG